MEDFILKSGYGAVCLNLLENSASLLLAELLKETRLSLTVTGFITSLPGIPEETREKVQAFAGAAGIGVRTVSSPNKASGLDESATAAWLMRQWAEEEGALPLSSLTGTDIMTAPRFLPAALAADFMPLGDLYETELTNLFPGFISPAPEAAMRDGFLIRLHRKHESATELANRFPESEREIRRLQRQARRIRMDAPETAAPPHAALHPRNAGNSLYPSAGRLTRNLPFPPVAYIALALEAEEMISRSHAIPCSNHDRPRRFKAG